MEDRVTLGRVSSRRLAFVVGAVLAIILGAILWSVVAVGSASHPASGSRTPEIVAGQASQTVAEDPYSPRDPLPAAPPSDPYSPRDPLG